MVYLVQAPQGKKTPEGGRSTIDVSSAAKFGELRVLLEDGDVILSLEKEIGKLREKLVDFGDDDYLLLIGDPVGIGMAVVIAAEMNRGRVKVLRWMKRNLCYIPLSLNFREGGE